MKSYPENLQVTETELLFWGWGWGGDVWEHRVVVQGSFGEPVIFSAPLVSALLSLHPQRYLEVYRNFCALYDF